MAVQQLDYEALLAQVSNHANALELLKQYRPYLEAVPSIRQSAQSLITVPLPAIEVRREVIPSGTQALIYQLICLPCELAYLMYDPEWKIKTGIEIFVFIHRPEEEFSQLLGRWRQTQVLLSQGYRWRLPPRYKDFPGEGSEKAYPLFVVFSATPERIKQGLRGAYLPYVTPAQLLPEASKQAEAEGHSGER